MTIMNIEMCGFVNIKFLVQISYDATDVSLKNKKEARDRLIG